MRLEHPTALGWAHTVEVSATPAAIAAAIPAAGETRAFGATAPGAGLAAGPGSEPEAGVGDGGPARELTAATDTVDQVT